MIVVECTPPGVLSGPTALQRLTLPKVFLTSVAVKRGTVALTIRQKAVLGVAELKMFRFYLGVTRLDRIKNKHIRGTANVGYFRDKEKGHRGGIWIYMNVNLHLQNKACIGTNIL